MFESLVLCGIGFLTACLLALVLFPAVQRRAAQMAMKGALAGSWTLKEIFADKDKQRAQFVLAVRRVEIGLEELKAKSERQACELGRLKVELEKKVALIAALQAREQAHKSVTKRVVKLLLFRVRRSARQRQRPLLSARQIPRAVVQ
jgi:hypothetical protein